MKGKYACLRCGKTFARKFNMNQHFRTFHEAEEDKEEMENDVDSSSSSGSGEESQGSDAERLEKNEAFRRWLDEAREASRKAGKAGKVPGARRGGGRCRRKGLLEDHARNQSEVFRRLRDSPWEYKTLEFNDVHRDVLDTLEERLSDGVDIHHAIKRAVAKHKPEFEGLFQELDEDSEDDEDPQEEEEEEDPSVRMV